MIMKRDLQNRYLRLIIGKDHIQQIEKFVELICDDYHIYDEYYANIIASNTMLAEYICEISNDINHRVDIRFIADKRGLRFVFYLGDLFLDFAKYFEKSDTYDITNHHDNDENLQKIIVIKLLSDSISIDQESEKVELIFRISGVNEMLTNQRIELLNKYFNMVEAEIRQ
jgi:hypothetical protein